MSGGGLLALVVWMVVAGPAAARQEPTVKDGVYSTDQAARGRGHYESSCQRCHGADLSGGAGRSLVGDVFLRDWTGLTLDRLFNRMQAMPPGSSESLEADVYVDIISYVLETNGFPAGGDELSTGRLTGIRVEGEDGPGVVPNFSLVRVVGCLRGSAADGWSLTDATAEVRTADPEPSSGDDLVDVRATELGQGGFQLMYVFPSPEPYLGHKVETKGLLIRGDTDSLNVTSVQSLAPGCGRP
jgi:mono/diheme cytochrome c family protein